MNNSLKMVLTLTVVSLLSGAGLVFVYNFAQPQIVANQKKELEEAKQRRIKWLKRTVKKFISAKTRRIGS